MESRLLYRLLICIILVIFTAGFGFSSETVHVMQRGETIYSIARSYGVNVQEVLELNRISDARTVQAGARIRIPSTAQLDGTARLDGTNNAAAPRGYEPYIIQRNETLFSLARRFGTTVPELLEMNGFAPNYVIRAGETIRIPIQQPAAAQSRTQNSGQTAGSTSNPPASGTAGNPVRVNSSIRWPIQAREISQITGRLNGVQITGERNEGVRSLTAGTVVSAMPYRNFGRVAIVQATGGYLYVYGGFETLSVKEGDRVNSGTELGKLGIDPGSAKPQLFFFVYRGSTPIDPATAPRS